MQLSSIRNAAAGLALGVASLAAPSISEAAVLSTGSASTTFTWNYVVSATQTLSGSGSIAATGFNSNELILTIALNNTATNTGQGGDRLTSFGFGIDPNVTGVTFSDANDGGITGAQQNNIPSLASIEVCAFSNNNCSGGGNGGIFAGASDTFQLRLSGTWGNSVTIDPLGFKYQTGTGSYEFTSTQGGPNPTPAPEPMSLALFGVALAGLGAAARRRSR